ncbi:MAG: superoxide dismutase family protein [Acidobacteriota bacterium]|nr:superoxide dismutase family protein [Acidobacteriota bacterium]
MRPNYPVHPVLAGFALSLAAFTLVAVGFQARSAYAEGKQKKGALLIPIAMSNGDSAGTASFKESKDGKELIISLKLKNLPPGDHAVHIHANSVCDQPDFKGAGGHFNPETKQHGMDNPMGHHAGDLPKNVTVGEDHTAQATFKVNYLSLGADASTSVIGHSIMIHEKADDMKTDPTGNAGNRIACGVINAPAM